MKMISFEDIKKAKEIANKNFMESIGGDEGVVGFEFNGTFIVNPWIDDSGRYDLTDKEAIELYGLENVLNFILNIIEC